MNNYKPLLTENSKKTTTYRIANLFYVALFGGVTALTFIGLKNAQMLRLRKSVFWTLLMLSIVSLVGKIVLIWVAIHNFELPAERFGFSIFKIPDLLLFAVYYHALKVPYRLHMVYHSEYYNMSYRGLSIYASLISLIIDIIICVALFS
ncbi:hypothetical protein [Cohnella abietis]|uniref:Uncharacterized protein n=1 Tax=Cohnella abietis TaxID=2507935 RepID=A0A3T1CYQ7_9BACL|nr:hypothetical protein [Cohnella abietis]BBI30885.1 hypothetical protein KCTCHS21_02840 [Cohnella abietis]